MDPPPFRYSILRRNYRLKPLKRSERGDAPEHGDGMLELEPYHVDIPINAGLVSYETRRPFFPSIVRRFR